MIVYPDIFTIEAYENDKHFITKVIDLLKYLDLEQSVLQRVNNDIFIDPNINWIDHLSPGEAQRLNLARVLYHKPKVVFLDESTVALSESMEEKIMLNLYKQNSITIVTCGHRESLKKFHQLQLHINVDGTFELTQLNDDH